MLARLLCRVRCRNCTTDRTFIMLINQLRAKPTSHHFVHYDLSAVNDAGEVSCTASMGVYTSDMVSESESDFMEDAVGDEFVPIEPDDREELTRTPTPVMARHPLHEQARHVICRRPSLLCASPTRKPNAASRPFLSASCRTARVSVVLCQLCRIVCL